ncbi:MAG: serine/threonine protein kinase, partial [Actinomycetota bacterium]|nr:serine/threonine protein kinase [Actinomycetota bacterium]
MTTYDETTQAGGRLVAGRYRLLDRLGQGGMGIVWRAEDEVLRRPVAVKELFFPPNLGESEQSILRERTMREARMAARIDHPAAVRVYDVVEDDLRPCIVMELINGRTLGEVVAQDGPLSPVRAAEVGLSVLDALEAAHAAGIVHRDVKPGNVLLRDDGRVTLTDFGIATSSGDSTLTSAGLLLGSPAYIAPERARGLDPGPASDLWSLGATLFTAVEGRPPFDHGEALATMLAVVGDEHEPFRAAGPLEPVLARLLAKEPGARPSADEARRELSHVAGLQGKVAGAAAAVAARDARPEPDAVAGGGHTRALALPVVDEALAATAKTTSADSPPAQPVPA